MAGEHAGTAAAGTGLGGTVPPQGVPVSAQGVPVPSGRRARQGGEQHALPPALPAAPSASGTQNAVSAQGTADADVSADGAPSAGRRRRALAASAERAATQDAGARTVFALPPAEADRSPEYIEAQQQAQQRLQQAEAAGVPHGQTDDGRHDTMLHDPADDHTPPQPHPVSSPTGRRRAVRTPVQQGAAGTPAQGVPAQAVPAQAVPGAAPAGQPVPASAAAAATAQPVATPAPAPWPGNTETPAGGVPAPQPWPNANPNANPNAQDAPGAGTPAQPGAAPAPAQPGTPAQAAPSTPGAPSTALPPERPAQPRVAQPLPAEAAAPVDPNSTQARGISVRTLGQGVPFGRQPAPNQPQAPQAQAQAQLQSPTPPPHQTNGGGRRRKLGTPPSRPPSARRRRPGRTRRAGRPPGRGWPEPPRAPDGRTP